MGKKEGQKILIELQKKFKEFRKRGDSKDKAFDKVVEKLSKVQLENLSNYYGRIGWWKTDIYGNDFYRELFESVTNDSMGGVF